MTESVFTQPANGRYHFNPARKQRGLAPAKLMAAAALSGMLGAGAVMGVSAMMAGPEPEVVAEIDAGKASALPADRTSKARLEIAGAQSARPQTATAIVQPATRTVAEPAPQPAAIEREPVQVEAAIQVLAPRAVKTISISKSAAVLPSSSPRWAIATPVGRNPALAALEKTVAGALKAEEPDNKPNGTALALADEPKRDKQITASVRREAARNAAPAAAPTALASKAGSTGFATVHVNLRAGPDNGKAVVSVVPAQAAVTVHGCKVWCDISYRGKRGFVIKKFVKLGSAKRPLNALAGG